MDDESQPLPGPPGPRGEEFIERKFPMPPLNIGYPIRYYSIEFGARIEREQYLPTMPGTLLEFGGGWGSKVPRWRRRGPGRWLWRAWTWARYGGLVRSVPWRLWSRAGVIVMLANVYLAVLNGLAGSVWPTAVGAAGAVACALAAITARYLARIQREGGGRERPRG